MNLGELVREVQKLTQEAGMAYNRGQTGASETKLIELRDLLNAEIQGLAEVPAETSAEPEKPEQPAEDTAEEKPEPAAGAADKDGSSGPEAQPSEE